MVIRTVRLALRTIAAVILLGGPALALTGATAGATPVARTVQHARTAGDPVTQAAAGPVCGLYTPTDLAINVPSAVPGETVTITGIFAPGETVSIRIATLGGPPIILGTAVTNSSGFFSADITIPADFQPGTYNVTVTSPGCPQGAVITLIVEPNDIGSCESNSNVFTPGQSVSWRLFTIFDPSSPVALTLVAPTPDSVYGLYAGPYPASGATTIVFPSTAPNGAYLLVETGIDRTTGKAYARGCDITLQGGTTTTTTTTAPGSSTTTTIPSSVLGVTTSTTPALVSVTVPNNTPSVGSGVLGASTSRSGTTGSGSSVSPSSLATTGTSIRPLIVAAVTLIGLGGLLLLQVRRRRS